MRSEWMREVLGTMTAETGETAEMEPIYHPGDTHVSNAVRTAMDLEWYECPLCHSEARVLDGGDHGPSLWVRCQDCGWEHAS